MLKIQGYAPSPVPGDFNWVRVRDRDAYQFEVTENGNFVAVFVTRQEAAAFVRSAIHFARGAT